MLEQLYVARAWGLSEEVLPMSTVDDTIKMTTSTYQERSGMQTPGVNGRNGAKSLIPMAARQLTSTEATSAFKPSMLLDIESGRPFELEAIVGSVLDRARMKAVETPRLDVLYAILKINQDAAVRKQADSQHDLHRAVSDWAVRKPAVSGASASPPPLSAVFLRADSDRLQKHKRAKTRAGTMPCARLISRGPQR